MRVVHCRNPLQASDLAWLGLASKFKALNPARIANDVTVEQFRCLDYMGNAEPSPGGLSARKYELRVGRHIQPFSVGTSAGLVNGGTDFLGSPACWSVHRVDRGALVADLAKRRAGVIGTQIGCARETIECALDFRFVVPWRYRVA